MASKSKSATKKSVTARRGYTKAALSKKSGPQLRAAASRYGLTAKMCKQMKCNKADVVKIVYAASNKLISVSKKGDKKHITTAEAQRAMKMKSVAVGKKSAPRKRTSVKRRISVPKIKKLVRKLSVKKRKSAKKPTKKATSVKRRKSAKKPTLKKPVLGRQKKLSHMTTKQVKKVAQRKRLSTAGKRTTVQKRISRQEKKKVAKK